MIAPQGCPDDEIGNTHILSDQMSTQGEMGIQIHQGCVQVLAVPASKLFSLLSPFLNLVKGE